MRLDSEVWLPRPLDEVFAFFAEEALTPPWLHFRIRTPGAYRDAPRHLD